MDPIFYVVAIVGAAFAGAINTFAGNGSAITLTILTEVLQLPPNMANATNRVGILSQCTAGSYVFYKNGKLDIKKSLVYIIPTIIGALVGVIVVIQVSNEQFKSVFSFLMVGMLFVILVNPKRWLKPAVAEEQPNLFLIIPAFLALGFYGGFIQMGMGVFFLAAMVLGAKYNITESNAVKTFVVGAYTTFVLAIFQWQGLVDWELGLVMAFGQTIGGWSAATYASKYPKADLWAYRLLVVVVLFAVVKLFGLHTYIYNLF